MNLSSRPYLTTLTPLRGIAAILVVIFHSNLMLSTFLPIQQPHFINAAWLWVDFFFVLSGFIITYVYGEAFKYSLTAAAYWKYIKARFARVYPLHIVTMLWCLICAIMINHYSDGLAPFFHDMLNPMAAVPSLFLIQSFGLYISAPLNTPSWSLGTEWWTYMIFPLLVPLFVHLRTLGKLFTLVIIISCFLFIKYSLGPKAQPFPGGLPTLNVVSDFGFFRCLAGFLTGMFFFKLYEERFAYKLLRRSWMFAILFAGTLVCMHNAVDDILVIPFFPLIILAAAYNTTEVKRMLDTRILQRLGDWSFSIYMVHVPIIYVFWILQMKADPTMFAKFPPLREPPDFWIAVMTCAFVLACTLLLASLTYRYIEVPARSYLNSRFRPKALESIKVVN